VSRYDPAEVEQAFQHFWITGVVREDWRAWAALFTDDVVYYERVLGTMRGREAVLTWIEPLMVAYPEIYGVYRWHMVDPSGRVVFAMENRRDRPGGGAPIDFPGLSVLQYAGDGLWSMEEDWWALPAAKQAMASYESLASQHDPNHRARRSRLDWGDGPVWTRP